VSDSNLPMHRQSGLLHLLKGAGVLLLTGLTRQRLILIADSHRRILVTSQVAIFTVLQAAGATSSRARACC